MEQKIIPKHRNASREIDMVRRELFYNILFEFVMTMKLGELTAGCANEI